MIKKIIKKALVSVSDKSNLKVLADFLYRNKIEVLSTGGTAKELKTLNPKLKLSEISHYTGSKEILDGRVKTLHPKIHAGILADRNNKKHMIELKKNCADPIDLVVVNLYPFEEISLNSKNNEQICIENIDIGGPTMIRAAAKNYKNVIILSDPESYLPFIKEFEKKMSVSDTMRKNLAIKAFETTSYYESLISNWFNKKNSDPCHVKSSIPLKKISKLRYGENPHQTGSFYSYGDHKVEQINGKDLSFNNIYDLESAVSLANEFSENCCVIVKHGNPCGVACGKIQHIAYAKALECDEVSAFGGVIAFNSKVTEKTAEMISKIFTEVVIAPDFESKAQDLLSQKKNLILIRYRRSKKSTKFNIKSTENFILVQERNKKIVGQKDLKVKTKEIPNRKSIKDMLFAFTVSKYVNSNAIVLVKDLKTIGIGVGQTSRVDSTKLAINKAKKKYKGDNIVLASDGFFPFPDIVKLCSKNNIKYIIQPGGSINDEKVIKEANKLKLSIVFTNIRHFKH
jgi:phosphoribosylaminoimidazolecarboxamide formyltransferase/IMP cyclohydrolase